MNMPLPNPPLTANPELESGHNGHPLAHSPQAHGPQAHAGEIRQVSQAIRDRLTALHTSEEQDAAKSSGWFTARTIFLVTALLIAVGAVAIVLFYSTVGGEDPNKGLEYRPLERGKVILTIIEKGNVEAVKNTELICQVRSSGRGSSSTTIVEVKDNGTWVNKGDVVMQLDDSALKDQLENQKIVVDEKTALYTQAVTDMEILQSQLRNDLQLAQDRVRIAELDLDMYDKGSVVQKRKDIEGRLTIALADYLQWQEKVATSDRLLRKKAISPSQYDSDLAKFQAAEIKLQQIEEEKRVLETYERERNLVDYRTKLSQAKENLSVTKSQGKGKLALAEALVKSRESGLNIAENQLANLSSDIANCRITAPNDGRIVYFIEQSRFGASSQSPIAPGQPVQFGQKLMRIPDPSAMQVRIKIHESIVLQVKGDGKRPTHFSQWLSGASAPILVPNGWESITGVMMAPRIHYGFDKLEEVVVDKGQPAEVKVPAREKPFAGRVSYVAPGESTIDFSQPDVKVYESLVLIDEAEKVDALKPGMSAEVVILVDETGNDVKRVPVQAMIDVGGRKFLYVKGEDGRPERRFVKAGLNNNKFVEIKDEAPDDLPEGEKWGVDDGAEVVQNPRELAERLGHLSSTYSERGERLGGKQGGKRPPDTAAKPPTATKPKTPGDFTPEQREQMMKQAIEHFRGLTPEKRKEGLQNVPAQYREEFKKALKKAGIDVPD